uniref:Uncharacterized protein n=1 Tax=Triticum urartu TaxID=4572 RepID=A0A8R7Q0J3_TRIUA
MCQQNFFASSYRSLKTCLLIWDVVVLNDLNLA